MKKYIWILIAFVLHGCFAEDKIVTPGEIDIVEIPYSLYDYQVWYSLTDRQIVAQNLFSGWDLGFESSGSNHRIILNSAKFMYAGNTGSTDFAGIVSNICDTMIYDDSRGFPYASALDAWADYSDPDNPVFSGSVFIIDRGFDNQGVQLGYKKVVFDRFQDNKYSVHFSNLDGSDEHYFDIIADNDRHFTLFSFEDGGKLSLSEPPSSTWDLCLTQYSTIIFDDNNIATPYLVRGALINQEGVTAVADSLRSFYDITAEDIPGYQFSSDRDAIGYEWKTYSNELYTINPNIFYLIKDQQGNFFKIKFTGYYNLSGGRGFPSFILEKL